MEYWNLYDYDEKKKKKIALRGTKLNDDDFHIVINAWLMNSKNEFLITQRSATKSHPLMWECTGGSALLGETAKDAAIREVREELGIDISNDDITLIGTTRRYYKNCPDILKVFIIKKDISLEKIKVQEEEVCNVMWASKKNILKLFKEGKFEANTFFNRVMNFDENLSYYYLGFNANNAICNENFFNGMITINPNGEKGNIYFTKNYIPNKDEKFMNEYKTFLVNTINNKEKNENALFLIFNEKIKKLLCNENNKNFINEKNYSLLKKLNDKEYVRNLLKNDVQVIDTRLVDNSSTFSDIKNLLNSSEFVMQFPVGSGGNNTFMIDNENKFKKYKQTENSKFFVSKFINHLPINSTLIIGKYDTIKLPSSVQLIKLIDDKFKYVGADFIYYQTLSENIKDKVNKYNEIIVNKMKQIGYQGILGIDYIIDENDNIYFMEINPRFQASSFIISEYLEKYCSTSIAELHYLAITDSYIGSNYLPKIDQSFLNCYNKSNYQSLKYGKILKNGFYQKNKNSYFRKIFNYSILKSDNFQKRKNID